MQEQNIYSISVAAGKSFLQLFVLLYDYDDDEDDDGSSFGAREADGPSSSLMPDVGLTSSSLESMIPVNTLIMARPDCIGPRPLAVQASIEAVEWT